MDKRHRLLELIEILKLPMTNKEAEDNVKSLSNEEIDLLVDTYEDIISYQDAVSDTVATMDPSSYEHITTEYNKKVGDAQSKYIANLENLQTKDDTQMDQIDLEADKAIDESVKKNETEIEEIELAHDDLYKKLNEVIKTPNRDETV